MARGWAIPITAGVWDGVQRRLAVYSILYSQNGS